MAVRSSPEQPLLKPWYRLAEGEDRMLLEYAHTVVCFEGAAAKRLLPLLLPLLDGTRTRDDLARCVGEIARPAVENALEVLSASGVLTSGPSLGSSLPVPFSATAEHLASCAPEELPPAEIARRLQTASVAVLGAGLRAEEVARTLRLSGVGDVHPLGEVTSARSAGLVVAAPEASELGLLESWNREALLDGVEWLQILPFDGRLAAVGPIFVPGETCCYECFRLRRASNIPYREDFWLLERQIPPFPSAPSLERASLAIGAYAAIRWLAYRDPSLAGAFHALELAESLALSVHHVYRVPRCPACSPSNGFGKPLPWFEAAPR